MPLPPNFQFSQNNLQDYIDCPRRFQLRHLLQQKWPALQSEPVIEQEYHMKQGQAFHQMAYQHQSGLPSSALLPSSNNIELWRWWHNYLENPPQNLPEERHPEFVLTAPFAGYRLIAKYDLLAVEPGQRIMIIDWKTSAKKPQRLSLQARMQTRLYRMLAVLAGWRLNRGQPVEPEQVEMVYWFAKHPEQSEHFQYDIVQFEADRAEVYRLVTQIASTQEGDFFTTIKEKTCTYCIYRSLCGRGLQAGPWAEMEDESEASLEDFSSFDFSQAGEIQF